MTNRVRSPAITALPGHNRATGEWNDSLARDCLWSRANFGEALPGVMTPLTWSLHKRYVDQMSLGPDLPFGGNIGGRFYTNVSQTAAMFGAVDRDVRRALGRWEPLIGRIPAEIEVRPVPLLTRSTIQGALPAVARMAANLLKATMSVSRYLATTADWCRRLTERIERVQTREALASVWRADLVPAYLHSMWVVQAAGTRHVLPASRLRAELIRLVGLADASALTANVGDGGGLATLEPLLGLARVVRGELSREAYVRQYGHRGQHELELSVRPPAEEPGWLDRRLAELARSPVAPEVLLARQRAEFEAAWGRLEARNPRKAPSVQRRLARLAAAVRQREDVRSELVRVLGVVRAWALRVGQLTGLGEEVFFLYLDEVLDALSGDPPAATWLAARRDTHARYGALPAYPAIINGRFDPFAWAADPNRRYDWFDARAQSARPASEKLTGFAGAAGCVEGAVRVLDAPEEGGQLQAGEVLVAATTNVGWTLLFARAAAVVTDVGAPLSHAAIVARELGIPAVVGCGDATTRLRTGDRVRVDGGQGVVTILEARRYGQRPGVFD